MTVVRFDTGSYRRGGQAYLDEAADLRSAVANHLAALDVERLGCTRGEHLADVALALAVPPLKEAFQEAVENLAGNLERVGQQLQDTSLAYDDIEGQNADAASGMADL